MSRRGEKPLHRTRRGRPTLREEERVDYLWTRKKSRIETTVGEDVFPEGTERITSV